MSGDAPSGRRLPVAGTRSNAQAPSSEANHPLRPDPDPPHPPDRFWNVILPAIGAVIILGAGIVGQCFGG